MEIANRMRVLSMPGLPMSGGSGRGDVVVLRTVVNPRRGRSTKSGRLHGATRISTLENRLYAKADAQASKPMAKLRQTILPKKLAHVMRRARLDRSTCITQPKNREVASGATATKAAQTT